MSCSLRALTVPRISIIDLPDFEIDFLKEEVLVRQPDLLDKKSLNFKGR